MRAEVVSDPLLSRHAVLLNWNLAEPHGDIAVMAYDADTAELLGWYSVRETFFRLRELGWRESVGSDFTVSTFVRPV